MDKEFLQKVLDYHSMWLEGKGGVRADLSGTKLRSKNLSHTDLRDADLRGADLYRAELRLADLRGADLRCADLSYTDLQRVDLNGANLEGADLRGADLSYTDLSNANLKGAVLRGADLKNTIGLPTMACPETGSFIGYKKAISTVDPELRIVTLEIPADAKRSSATTRKCRCSKAKVLSIEKCDGSKCLPVARSRFDPSTYYRVGETVEVSDFNEDRWAICSTGIHFFMTKQEAIEYRL